MNLPALMNAVIFDKKGGLDFFLMFVRIYPCITNQ